MTTQTKDLPGAPPTTSGSAANPRGRKPDPVCIDIPVQVRSIEGLPVPGSDTIPKPFREDTRTLIVFQQGGVLRMSNKVVRGQMLAVTHVKSAQEVPCRVVNVRSSGPNEDYVEVEFTQRVSGFWGIHFPSDPLNAQADTAREKAEAEKLAAEEAARAHTARVADAWAEADATEALRRQTAKAEAEKLAADKESKEKAAARFAADEKAVAERLEAAQLANQVAAQRAEAERIAAQIEAKRREDAARREAEREAELAEQQRLAEMREAAEKMAAERAAEEMAAKERQRLHKLEAEKAAREKAESEAHAAAERAAEEAAAKERERLHKLETERAAKEKAEAEARAAAERAAEEAAAKERVRLEKLEAEKAAKEKAQAEARAAREKKAKEVEETRAILAKVEAERRAAEIAAAERAAQEKAAAERLASEKAADTVLGYGLSEAGLPSASQERVESAREKTARDKAEALRKAVESAAAEKTALRDAQDAAKKLAEDKAAKSRAEKEHKAIVARLEKERLKNEKAAAKIAEEEKRAAKQLRAESRAAANSGAAVASTLFAHNDEAAEGQDIDSRQSSEGFDNDELDHQEFGNEESFDAGDSKAQAPAGTRSKAHAAAFGTLGAEIAHDRNELRRSKSRSALFLAIAASVLLVSGGAAWWVFLGPGSAPRDKTAQTNSAGPNPVRESSAIASPGSPVNLPASSPVTQGALSGAPLSNGSPLSDPRITDPRLPDSRIVDSRIAATNGATNADRSAASQPRPGGAPENKALSAGSNLANVLGGKDPRPGEASPATSASRPASSRTKDAPVPADPSPTAAPANKALDNKVRENKSASEEAFSKVITRPALDATMRAPVNTNSSRISASADAVPLPDVGSASSVASSSAATSVLGSRSGTSNGITPPPPTGGQVVQGRLLKSVPPVFPDLARQRHVEGDVVVRADVDAHGNVARVTVLSGPDLLRSSAVDSVKRWTYSPAQLNGQPVPMQVQITVKFRTTH